MVAERVNHLNFIISEFQRLFYEEFEKCNIKKCGHCYNGLKSKQDMTQYCDNCGGIGYVVEKIQGEYVCRNCRGGGCRTCSFKGTVDWIQHAMSSDIRR